MTKEEILQYAIQPGTDMNIGTHTPYATFEHHPEPYLITFSERPDWEKEPYYGKYQRDPYPYDFGKMTGCYAVPRPMTNRELPPSDFTARYMLGLKIGRERTNDRRNDGK